MRRTIKLITIILAVMLLAGCYSETWPRIRLERTSFAGDILTLPLRDGYTFADQMYTVKETDDGYDVIVHCVAVVDPEKEDSNAAG